MEIFGLFAFCMVIGLYAKVHRLERILRENGIGAKGAAGLGISCAARWARPWS